MYLGRNKSLQRRVAAAWNYMPIQRKFWATTKIVIELSLRNFPWWACHSFSACCLDRILTARRQTPFSFLECLRKWQWGRRRWPRLYVEYRVTYQVGNWIGLTLISTIPLSARICFSCVEFGRRGWVSGQDGWNIQIKVNPTLLRTWWVIHGNTWY